MIDAAQQERRKFCYGSASRRTSTARPRKDAYWSRLRPIRYFSPATGESEFVGLLVININASAVFASYLQEATFQRA